MEAMALTPVARSSRSFAGPLLLAAGALALGVGAYSMGRADRPTPAVVQVQCDCPAATAPAQPQGIAIRSAPSITWASSVRSFSSQYGDASWSATQVLGAPDVYPQHGDLVKAWASLGPDDRDEHVEVGFAQPQRISLVEIYETYNPGAISRVELVTTSGRRIAAPSGMSERASIADQGPSAQRHVVELGCTDEPIAAVRVTLASKSVPGWNELDAIGVAPCLEAP